jgi:hypothetical protein
MRRRRGDREHGRSFFEFVALGVLAAVIVGTLVATGLQGTLGGGVGSVVCRVVAAGHCGKKANGKSAQAGTGDGRSPATKNGKDGGKKNGKKDECHGVFGCAWHYASKYAGGVYGHAENDVAGLWNHAVDTYHDPVGTATSTWAGLIAPWKNNFVRAYHRWEKGDHAKAVGLLFVENYTEPYMIVYHTIIDDEVRKDWHDGNYAGAAGGVVYNVVSWLIPGADEAKGASTGSKLARGAEKSAGKEARAGEKAGKDAGKKPREKGDPRRKASACGAPASYRWPSHHVIAVTSALWRPGDTQAVSPASLPLKPTCLSPKAQAKKEKLPNKGKVRYVPPRKLAGDGTLPKGPQGGYIDKYGNEWVKGPSRTAGQEFEWDVQLTKSQKKNWQWLYTRKGKKGTISHLNVSQDGRITHVS